MKPLPPIPQREHLRPSVTLSGKTLTLSLDSSLMVDGRLVPADEAMSILSRGTCHLSRTWLAMIEADANGQRVRSRKAERDANYKFGDMR